MARIISKVTYSNTGNSVANHTEITYECDECAGTGMVVSEIGEVECKCCDGLGQWTERH